MSAPTTMAPGQMAELTDAFAGEIAAEEEGSEETTQTPEPEQGQPEEGTEEAEPEAPDSDPGEEEVESAEGEEPEEGAAEASATEDVYEVKVAGEMREVPVSELVAGYQQSADYTRKTQALADERRDLENEVSQSRQATQASLQQLQGLTAQLEGHLRAFQDDPEEMKRLLEEDPGEYVRRDALNRQRQEAIVAAQQAIQAENQRLFQASLPERKRELLRRLPAWQDEGVLKREFQEVGEFLVGEGIAPEEWAQWMHDPRIVSLAYKAMHQDKTAKAAPTFRKRVRKAPKIAPGGSRQATDGQGRKVRQARKAFLSDPSSKTAMADYLLESGFMDD